MRSIGAKSLISNHKIARTFSVSQERTNSRTNGLEQNKMVVLSCLKQGGRGERVSETGEKSEKYI